MFDWRSAEEWKRLWRYYQAGIVNTLFGYGAFVALVAIGLNMFLAQILAHLAGMAFNYITYSFYSFRGERSNKVNFVLSYTVNYLFSVSTLYLFSLIVPSAYLAGFMSIVVVSFINYFILKKFVFSGTPG